MEKSALIALENGLRSKFPSTGNLITICVGPKAGFFNYRFFHIARNEIQAAYHKTTLALTSPLQGLRFIDNPLLRTWTILFRTPSSAQARQLKEHIFAAPEGLLSLDGGVTGILAFNGALWLSAGLNAKEVIGIAKRRGISLSRQCAEGPALYFQVHEHGS